MRGSTRKRGSTWTAYWDSADPATGNRKQKSRGGFKRQKDAERFLSERLTAVNAGTYAEPSKDPLARFLADEWLPGISATIRPLTIRRYAAIVDNYIKPREIGTIPLRNLTGAHLNRLYTDLEAAGLSIATRRLTHAVLRRALNDAVRWGKLNRNPAAAADPPSLPRSRAESWSARELRVFLETVADDRLYALWRLAATPVCGAANCSDSRGEAWTSTTGGCASTSSCCPRKAASRSAPRKAAGRSARSRLTPTHWMPCAHTGTFSGSNGTSQDPHIRTRISCSVTSSAVRTIRRVSANGSRPRESAAGIPTGSLHILRHTSATLALTNGVPLHVVAGRLGDDPKTILSTYAHLLPLSDETAAENARRTSR